jgi:hypothetical protein
MERFSEIQQKHWDYYRAGIDEAAHDWLKAFHREHKEDRRPVEMRIWKDGRYELKQTFPCVLELSGYLLDDKLPAWMVAELLEGLADNGSSQKKYKKEGHLITLIYE